jgi:hypothetical protein
VEGILDGTNKGQLQYLQQYLDEDSGSQSEKDMTAGSETTSGIVS